MFPFIKSSKKPNKLTSFDFDLVTSRRNEFGTNAVEKISAENAAATIVAIIISFIIIWFCAKDDLVVSQENKTKV